MGDHGEGLGEYQSHFGHIHYLNNVYTHVPFSSAARTSPRRRPPKHPGLQFQRRPTLLQLIGAKPPGHCLGPALWLILPTQNFSLKHIPRGLFRCFRGCPLSMADHFFTGKTGDKLEFFNLQQDRFRHQTCSPDPTLLDSVRKWSTRSCKFPGSSPPVSAAVTD